MSGGHGASDVDEGLTFLADAHGVDDGVICGVDHVDCIAVFVYDVHARVIWAGPDTVGFDAAASDGCDVDGDGAGAVLAVDFCFVCGSYGEPGVGDVVDDGEVWVVGFCASF